MASLKDKYAIVGVGHSKLGKVPELSDYGLQVTAVKAALDDAGLKKTDVDAVITHSHLLGAVRVHHQMPLRAAGHRHRRLRGIAVRRRGHPPA